MITLRRLFCWLTRHKWVAFVKPTLPENHSLDEWADAICVTPFTSVCYRCGREDSRAPWEIK